MSTPGRFRDHGDDEDDPGPSWADAEGLELPPRNVRYSRQTGLCPTCGCDPWACRGHREGEDSG